ncbi:hypothetical protein [Nocardioides sp.]|uniref:5-oxoprolinase subunit C family protein n=1 Tax=Nocardioides sp. TaxID=35761 RepID=UPI002ED1FD8F
MTANTLVRVLEPGFTTVQDLGRPGYSRLGVGHNGAGDRHAACVASVLVGNDRGAPLFESTATGWSFTVDRPALVAVTGAAAGVTVAGQPQPVWQTLVVPPASPVVVSAPDRGWRSYVAIGGMLQAERTLGSVAPDPLLGVGTRLEPGQELAVRTAFAGLTHPHTVIPVFRFTVDHPAAGHAWEVAVTPGPEAGEFTSDVWDRLGDFEVSRDSDYVGLRLLGEASRRKGRQEMISRGVPMGAVQVPPTGGLLVLLRGRLVTAGYPILGVATTVAVDRLAQARPGDRVRFRPCATADAVADVRQQAATLAELERRVHAALQASGVERLH